MFVSCDSEEKAELDFLQVAILGLSTSSLARIIAEIIGIYNDNHIVFLL